MVIALLLPTTIIAEELVGIDCPADSPNMPIAPNPMSDYNVLSDEGFASYKTDIDAALDKYTNRSITFDIPLSADLEEMSNIFLILSVYDVDVESENPEIDKVYINDKYIVLECY